MPNTFTFTTDDPNIAQQALVLFGAMAGPVVAKVQPATTATAVAAPPPPPAAAAAAPVPPPAPVAPPAAPPPPPAAPTPPPAPAPVQQAAPEGWTLEHVTGALRALAGNPAKGGPSAVAAILTKYGAKTASALNPAQWPQVYADATA
jgi:hypothetical protein